MMPPTTMLESNWAVRSAWNGIRTLSYPEGAVRVRVFEKGRLARNDMMVWLRACYSFEPTEKLATGDVYVEKPGSTIVLGKGETTVRSSRRWKLCTKGYKNDKAEKREYCTVLCEMCKRARERMPRYIAR